MGKRGYSTCRFGGILILLACVLLLAGCGGKSASQPLLGSPDTGAAPPPGVDGEASDVSWTAPPLPQDAPLDPAEFAQRRSNYSQVQVHTGDEAYSYGENAAPNSTAQLMQLIAGPGKTAWAVYEFAGISSEDLPAQVSVELLPVMTEHLYFGLPDYELGAWQWQALPAGIGGYNLGVGDTMHTLSPAGSLYVALLCTDGDTAVITKLSCTVEVAAPPPVGLQASDGTHARIIYLSWEDPAVTYSGLDYESIIIERTFDLDDPWEELDVLLKGNTTYGDYFGVEDGWAGFDQRTYYRLRTVENGNPGEPGLMDYGYRWLNYVTEIDATDGLYYDRVEITWEPVPGADRQNVLAYRPDLSHTGFGRVIGELDGDVSSFSHTADSPPDYVCTYGAEFSYGIESLLELSPGEWFSEYGGGDHGFRILHPPQELTASYDRYGDRIELSWAEADGATGYIVYRDGRDAADIVATLGAVDTWSDYIGDTEEHSFWLRSTADEYVSDFGEVVIGRRSRWLIHELDKILPYKAYPLAVLNGKPIIACIDPSIEESNLCFGQATTVTPASSSDWVFHIVEDEIVSSGPRGLSLAVVGGKPAIAFGTGMGDEMLYARALTASPSSSDDWQIHLVDTGDWAGYSCSLVELDGKPAIAYYNEVDYDSMVHFARALIAEPSSSADWSMHAIENTDVWGLVSLAVYEGRPVIAHYKWRPRICRATSATPTSAADWQCHSVDDSIEGIDFWVSLAVVDSRLALAFNNDYQSQLQYAHATTATPASESDWEVEAVDLTLSPWSPGISLVDFNGVPAIGYCDDYGLESGAIFKAAIAAVAVPTSPADWTVCALQTTDKGVGYPNSFILAECNGTLLAVFSSLETGLMFGIYQ